MKKATLSMMLTAATLALVTGSVHAQTALGNGRGLEADLSGRGIGNAPRADFGAEVRLRNDLVTGNAVGGKAFRGNVGYKSPDEFRGALGSDDLFSFRRDSIGAGAAGLGLRGTNSIQYQYSYTTANQFGNAPGDVGNAISRSGGSTLAPKADFTSTPRVPKRVSTTEFSGLGEGWNELAPQMGTLRSTAAFNSTQGLNPSIIHSAMTRTGAIESLAASSLFGIRKVQGTRSDMSSPYVTSVTPSSGQQKVDPKTGKLVPANATDESGPPGSENAQVRTAYTDLIDRFDKSAGQKVPSDKKSNDKPGEKPGEKAGEKPDTSTSTKPGEKPIAELGAKPIEDTPDTPLWESRLTKLRNQLDKARELREAEQAKREEAGKHEDKSKKDKAKPAPKPDKRTQAEKDKDNANRFVPDFDPETLQMMIDAAMPVDKYVVTTADKDLYSRYMTQGAALLAQGKYFDAEEQFARCLAVVPGDPMASAARMNSQLGAALFLSAAVNGQALFEKHPEVIPIRYTGATMPNPKRLTDIAQVLRDRIANAKNAGLPPGRDAALLLAYVGYQLGDKAVTSEGFAAADEAGLAEGDALTPLLKSIWLK